MNLFSKNHTMKEGIIQEVIKGSQTISLSNSNGVFILCISCKSWRSTIKRNSLAQAEQLFNDIVK